MKKSTKRFGALKQKNSAGKLSAKSRNAKQKILIQKIRADKQAITAKLKALKAEFKQKLAAASTAAYEKAMNDFQRDHIKRFAAKQKAIAAAEAKFDKKFAKKATKKLKSSRRKNSAFTNTAKTPHASSKRLSKRGRPKKYA